ncbi:hypothetical protein [Alienimonas californiensis]|uniref:Uncharacterized protein n=1 Tax=Alienimonas californiensis TaxID=2527989 RepID=A0A517PF86_9PLAN|nr:hypothetical protein [Alienimonas californiensis]QDT18032.1 hypothetical protein CA12_41700 [Alienimonas californiensis]
MRGVERELVGRRASVPDREQIDGGAGEGGRIAPDVLGEEGGEGGVPGSLFNAQRGHAGGSAAYHPNQCTSRFR